MSVRHAEKAAAAQSTVHSVPENGAARREGDPEVFEQESAEEKNESQRVEYRPEEDTQEGKTEDAGSENPEGGGDRGKDRQPLICGKDRHIQERAGRSEAEACGGEGGVRRGNAASQTDVTKDGSLTKEQGEACRFSTYSPFSWVLSLDKVCTCVCVCVCVCVLLERL